MLKILVLSKRQYTNKDLLDDQYGRLWEIPFYLASIGHEIKGVCLSYRNRENYTSFFRPSADNNIEWISFNIFSGFISYLLCINQLLRKFKPDVILASSDCFHVIWGVVLGKIYQVPCVVDLYDNYESYKLSKWTMITPVYRLALKRAGAISCVSNSLKKFIFANGIKTKTEVVENAIDSKLFFSRPKDESREYFCLSKNVKVIGTAGHLHEKRGIDKLYCAFNEMAKVNEDLHLVLAGVGDREHLIFRHPNVIDFGVLSYEEIPFFFNMLDVAVICNGKDDFGLYCYPQKANEILACKIPVVATNVGVMSELFEDKPEHLFDIGDWRDLIIKLNQQLEFPHVYDGRINEWKEMANKMDALIRFVVHEAET